MQMSDKADDGTVYMRMDERHHRFLIHPGEEEDVSYFGFLVKDEQELDGIAAQVEEAGITVTPGSKEDIESRNVLGMIKFKDPTGFPVEVFYGAQVAKTPYYASRESGGFRTQELGLGHGVIWTPDLMGSVRFYRDVLGFTISDGFVGRAFFMHCNPRHHSLALFQQRPGVNKRMNHFMIQYNHLDDVGLAYDIAEKRGEKFATTLGRHGNDQNISFYVTNPSGWETECAWGARNVDDEVWSTEHFGGKGDPYWNHVRHANPEMGLGGQRPAR
jgi:2,3-dihydroxybiphenyl 1,2-dioxygenase